MTIKECIAGLKFRRDIFVITKTNNVDDLDFAISILEKLEYDKDGQEKLGGNMKKIKKIVDVNVCENCGNEYRHVYNYKKKCDICNVEICKQCGATVYVRISPSELNIPPEAEVEITTDLACCNNCLRDLDLGIDKQHEIALLINKIKDMQHQITSIEKLPQERLKNKIIELKRYRIAKNANRKCNSLDW